MGYRIHATAYWDCGNYSRKPGSLRGWMESTCHRKGRASSVTGSPRWWRGLLKSWCEIGILINPSPISLQRVDRSVVKHLRSSTWPFHYLPLLQFIKFEYHGVFFLFILPQTKPMQRQDVPGEQQGPQKQMGTGLFPANPGTVFTTLFPVLRLVLGKFLQARERGSLVT